MTRSIIHLDMDAFFAAVEQLDRPELKGKAVIVGWDSPRGVVAAASYEARPFGVRSAMPMLRAKSLCPGAVVVPPRRDRYRAVSQHIFKIIQSFTPQLEPVALDEAYFDVTASQKLFGPPLKIARQVKEVIEKETLLTSSAGIAPNKFVAKLASAFQKPNGLTEVREKDIPAFLGPLPVEIIGGVGEVTHTRLNDLGVRTIADLAGLSKAVLTSRFGAYGFQLFDLSRGIDNRPVQPNRAVKSIGEEQTFDRDLPSLDRAGPILLRQAENLSRRLRKRHLMARTVSLKIKWAQIQKNGKYITQTRSQTQQAAFDEASQLHEIARTLLGTLPHNRSARLIGLSCTNFSDAHPEVQLEMFGASGSPPAPSTKIGPAIDKLEARYGASIVHYGTADSLRIIPALSSDDE